MLRAKPIRDLGKLGRTEELVEAKPCLLAVLLEVERHANVLRGHLRAIPDLPPVGRGVCPRGHHGDGELAPIDRGALFLFGGVPG